MKRSLIVFTFILAILSFTTPAFAHHSFSSEFDIHQPVTLVGKLTKLDWVNPHGFLYLDVKGGNGKVVNWAVETGGPNALLRLGVRKTDFVMGTTITVKGYKAKSGLPIANGRTITLENGRSLFAGSSGTGAPKDGADPNEAQY
jgi:hypothetical protein